MTNTIRITFSAAVAVALLFIFTGASRGEDNSWLTDIEAAKAKAKAEKKLLLVDFTGSDWCVWCKRLHNEVFEKEPFTSEAPKRFVLVELDYPHEKEFPKELRAQNEKAAKKYKIHGFPTVLIIDAEGEVVARTGYRFGGPEKYITHLGDLFSLHESVVKMQGELATATGLDRAKLLDRIVDAVGGALDPDSEKIEPWCKEIIALDSEYKAGLRSKYEVRLAMAEVSKLIKSRKFSEAQEIVNKVQALPGLTGVQKQEIYFSEASLPQVRVNMLRCVKVLKMALDAAPDGPRAAAIKSMLERFEERAKQEEAALKLKEELDKADGPERLKLLDKAIDAYAKTSFHADGKDCSEEVEKWCEEIVRLDPDNKENLKNKHEHCLYSLKGQRFFRIAKPVEAQAAFEKALAVPEQTPREINRVHVMICNCLLMQRKYQKTIDYAKECMKTAQGSDATIFKLIRQQAEKALEHEKEGKGNAVEDKSAATAKPASGEPL
jgi:thioredoxin-related protein